jgi:hypothetical protein
MTLGWLGLWCALFALAYGILILGYRKKKLSLRRFAILHAVLIVVFPVAASLSLAREPLALAPTLLASGALGIGAIIGTWAALRLVDPPDEGGGATLPGSR